MAPTTPRRPSTGRRPPVGRASRPLGGLLGGARREVLPAGTSGAGRRLAGYGRHGQRRREHPREDVHPQGRWQGDEVCQEVDGHRQGQAGRRQAASEKEGRQERGQRIGTAGPEKEVGARWAKTETKAGRWIRGTPARRATIRTPWRYIAGATPATTRDARGRVALGRTFPHQVPRAPKSAGWAPSIPASPVVALLVALPKAGQDSTSPGKTYAGPPETVWWTGRRSSRPTARTAAAPQTPSFPPRSQSWSARSSWSSEGPQLRSAPS